jgi:beta-lactamase class A
MKVVLEEINKGSLSENQQLSRNVIDLNNDFDISSDEADMQDGVISYTVQEALTKMITQSDNYAAYLLTDTVGFDKVKTFLQKYGFSQSSFSQPPKTSAADIAQFFEKLYNGELADAATTQKMLNLLKGQRINGKLPKYLPEEVSIAHKTGELEAFSHDAGIVFSPAGDYSIVILSETNNPPEAVESIATISKDVYNYFNR